jgi:hypothetical protein
MKIPSTDRSFHSIEPLETRIAPAGIIAAAGGGLLALFTDTDADGTYQTRTDGVTPFAGYKGAITVAMGDFDGDGNDEMVTAQATPKAAIVRVWDISGGGQIGAARGICSVSRDEESRRQRRHRRSRW